TKIKWLTEFLETWYSDEYKNSSLILAEKGKAYTPANNLVLRAAFDEIEASDYASAQTKLTKYLDRAEKYKYDTGEKRLLNEILLLMLSRNQYHSAQDLFNRSENLREVLKPTYYALLTLLKKEYPNEIIKMGSELDQPVKDILNKVTEMPKH